MALVRQLRQLQAVGPVSGVFLIGWHIGLAAAAALACAAVLRATDWGWVLVPVTALLIGTRMRALGNIVHECSHFIFVRSPRWNQILGELLCIADFSSFACYKREHLTHHRDLGDHERDLDLAGRRDLLLELPVGNVLRDYAIRALSLRTIRTVFKPVVFSREDAWFVNAARLAWLIFLGTACFMYPAPMMLYVVLPYFTTYQMLKGWSDCLDHGGLIKAPEEFGRSRNHIFPVGMLNWLFLPRNDPYHLVHHLFPKLPTRHYEKVHHLLLTHPAYAKREHSLGWQDVTPAGAIAGERASPQS